MEEDEKVMKSWEVSEQIKQGKFDFQGITVNDDLYLREENIMGLLSFKKATINGDLYFRKTIINGTLDLREITINGNLNLGEKNVIKDDLNASRAKISNNDNNYAYLEGIIVNGAVSFDGAVIESELTLEKATIGGLYLYEAKMRNLYLGEATINGKLNLGEATVEYEIDLRTSIEGEMDLSMKKYPKKIYALEKDAQLIHWAAPRVPLVITK